MEGPPRDVALLAGGVFAAVFAAADAALRTARIDAAPVPPWAVSAVVSAALAALAATCVFDAPHFLRLALQFPKPRMPLLATERRHFFVGPWDVDRNGHLNNAKYLRVANYARRSFWTRVGVWLPLRKRAANLVVTATGIRYRREIRGFSKYAVDTRLVAWEGKCFFVEHRFEAAGAPFVLAIATVKYRLVSADRELTAAAVLSETVGHFEASPPQPHSLKAFIAYDKASSEELRPKANAD
ncbi:HotDog domain-containing protein [Pelagophyceae sp. CCMP2097]|nr:HotDog domain-containing protein [Pelagophyceae sp. CCMP2097]